MIRKFSFALIVTALIVTGVNAFSAQAVPLNIVEVAAPSINCKFHVTCSVVVEDTTDDIVLSAGGINFLQTRTIKAKAGSPADGMYGYLYRLDMTQALGIVDISCVETLTLDFGHVVNGLDYNNDGTFGDEVFVINRGGLGSIGIASADKNANMIKFTFASPVCAGSQSQAGDSSYFFGLVSTQEPRFLTATVRDDLVPVDRPVEVRVPDPAKFQLYWPNVFDLNEDRFLDDLEFFNVIDVWLSQATAPGSDQTLDDLTFFVLIDWWVGGNPLDFALPRALPVRKNSAEVSYNLKFSNNMLSLNAQSLNAERVSLSLFNTSGQEILNETVAGSQLRVRALTNSGQALANGVYLYRVSSWNAVGELTTSEIKKLVIVR